MRLRLPKPVQSTRIAITGLSRSGKTVLLTTLAQHLLNWQRQNMPNFPKKAWAYPVRARLRALPVGRRRFPYEENIALLRESPPRWPQSTADVSELHFDLSFRRTNREREPHGTWRKIHVEFVDYPGEWLTDLPLLTLSYADWSTQVHAFAKEAPRKELAREWLASFEKLSPDAPATPALASRLTAAYRAYVQACRKRGLIYVQPGRLLQPGTNENNDLMMFCPLPASMSPPQTKRRSDGAPISLYDQFAARYEEYKRTIVRPFVDNVFYGANVQIVLLDLFNILNTGLYSYNDHRRCIEDVIRAMHYGRPSWFVRNCVRPIFGGHSIENTIFVASKADHATAPQHANLEKLLSDIVATAQDEATGHTGTARIANMIFSAINCTKTIHTRENGAYKSYLEGVIKDEEVKGTQTWDPGDVPDRFPDNGWDLGLYQFRDFAPVRVPLKHGATAPHINLDMLLGLMLESCL